MVTVFKFAFNSWLSVIKKKKIIITYMKTNWYKRIVFSDEHGLNDNMKVIRNTHNFFISVNLTLNLRISDWNFFHLLLLMYRSTTTIIVHPIYVLMFEHINNINQTRRFFHCIRIEFWFTTLFGTRRKLRKLQELRTY